MEEFKICLCCWEKYYRWTRRKWAYKISKFCSKKCSIQNWLLSGSNSTRWKKLTEEQKLKLPNLFQKWHTNNWLSHLQKWRNNWWIVWNKWVYWYELHGWFKKTKLQQSIRTSQMYLNRRNQVFQRDKYTCTQCWLKSCKWSGRISIHAHHIKAFYIILIENNINSYEDSIKCSELWDINNWQTLCKDCHKHTDSYKINQFSKWDWSV